MSGSMSRFLLAKILQGRRRGCLRVRSAALLEGAVPPYFTSYTCVLDATLRRSVVYLSLISLSDPVLDVIVNLPRNQQAPIRSDLGGFFTISKLIYTRIIGGYTADSNSIARTRVIVRYYWFCAGLVMPRRILHLLKWGPSKGCSPTPYTSLTFSPTPSILDNLTGASLSSV